MTAAEPLTSAPTSLLDAIAGHAIVRPNHVAVEDDFESLTYDQLLRRVKAEAAGLGRLGIGVGDRVAIYRPNSVAFVSAALACLYIGAAFVPLSVTDPELRLEHIVSDCQASLVVGGGPTATSPGDWLPSRTAFVEDLAGLSIPGEAPLRAEDPGRDAYLIYTSGTTGQPKGVRISESGFRWAITAISDLLGLSISTRSLCVSPFYFDGSYGTLFPTLLAGATVVIPQREALVFVKRFIRSIREEGITHTGCSPSYLRMVLAARNAKDLSGSGLQTLGLGGEECLASDVARLWDLMPGLRIFNRYGPTETTIEVTTWEVERSSLSSGRVPIGRPHPGVDFHLLDANRRSVTGQEEVGELYIGGAQLMLGYWGDGDLSARVLLDDAVEGRRVYKTGDLVYRDSEENYVFVGRADDVIKRHGIRISLDELNRAFREIPGVEGAACSSVAMAGTQSIVAYVVAGVGTTVTHLREAASRVLPPAMLPDEIRIVDVLPLTDAGKVDRRLLRAGVVDSNLHRQGIARTGRDSEPERCIKSRGTGL